MENRFNLQPVPYELPAARPPPLHSYFSDLTLLPTVAHAQPTVNLSDYAQLLGPPVPTHTFDISRSFDTECADAHNFGIGDNALGVVNAVLSGLCVYLLADVVFRLGARCRSSVGVTSAGIFRAALVQRVANPLYWPTFVGVEPGGKTHRKPADDLYVSADDAAMLANGMHHASRSSRLALGLAGLFLCSAELLFIFLATNRSSTVAVDKALMPSFVWTDRQDKSIFAGIGGCRTTPIVNKTGFQAEARISLCDLYAFSAITTQTHIAADTAQLIIKWTPWTVLVETISRKTHGISYLFIHITPQAWPEQQTSFAKPGPRAHNAMLAALTQRDIPIVSGSTTLRTNFSTAYVEMLGVPWEFRTVVNYTGLRAPANLAGELASAARTGAFDPADLTFAPPQDVMWAKYVKGIVFALFAPTGRAEAVNSADKKTPFTDYDGPLITKNRPWLSVVGWIVLVGSLLVAWLFVAVVMRWEAGVEYSSSLTAQFLSKVGAR